MKEPDETKKNFFADKDRGQIELEAFRHEIDGIVEEEAREGKTAHFQGEEFKSNELILEDMDIWNKIKSGRVTMDDIYYYRHRIKETGATASRKAFAAFVANKATPIIGRRQLEEEARKNDPRR